MKTIYEWIADYSAGTLTEPEAKVFRDRLENDGEVKRLFTDVRQMETVLKCSKWRHLRRPGNVYRRLCRECGTGAGE